MIPPEWLPPVAVRRIIVHEERAGEIYDDLRLFYHFLIAKSGAVARGFYTIADNAAPRQGLAKHTNQLNVGSVGIVVVGKEPTPEQWQALVELVALLCQRYMLEVNERTVLTHSEVERVYGIPQEGATDLEGLGDALRQAVNEAVMKMERMEELAEPDVYQYVLVGQKRKLVGKVENGRFWLHAVPLAKASNVRNDPRKELPTRNVVIYGVAGIAVPLRDFVQKHGLPVFFDPSRKMLMMDTIENVDI